MEMDSSGEGSTEPNEFENFCIREYVAEVRKRDWKKCCPFKLSGDSNSQAGMADMVLASLLLENNDALDSTPENAEAPNSSEVGNSNEQEARFETPLVFTASEVANSKEQEARSETPPVLTAYVTANSKVQEARSETPTVLTATEVTNSKVRGLDNSKEQEARSETPTVFADIAIQDDAPNTINDGPSESDSSKVKAAQCQNEESIAKDAMAAESDKPQRNLAWRKPQKFRQLSDILKELAGPCDAGSANNFDREFSTESEDDSDDVTLDTFIREKKGVRVTSKSSGALKKKRKTTQVLEPRLDQAKRSKPVSEDSRGNHSELGSKCRSRKKIDELDLQTTKKRKSSSAEIRHSSSQILHENNGAPSSLGGEEDTSGTRKDSLLLSGHKGNRENVQEDCAREVLKLLDGSQTHFTEEENRLRPAHGMKSTQLVQHTTGRNVLVEHSDACNLVDATTTISNKNTETASGCVQKRIRESSPSSDNESIAAALQLLRLSNAGVHTMTSSMTATKDPALSVAKRKSSCELDGVVPPASGSMVCQPLVEAYMINGAGLAQAAQRESGTCVCPMNRNPADFTIHNAKNRFMRRGQVLQK